MPEVTQEIDNRANLLNREIWNQTWAQGNSFIFDNQRD